MRRLFMLIGTVLGVAIGGFIATTFLIDTTAQEDRDITFAVTWPVQDDPKPCTRTTTPNELIDGNSEAIHFAHVISLRDETGAIVQMVPMHGEPAEDSPALCQMEVRLTVGDDTGYTIWYEDRYMASIPAGEDPPPYAGIVLRD